MSTGHFLNARPPHWALLAQSESQKKKPQKEIERLLKGLNRIFIIGCGTCVTLTRTGGDPEVREMKTELSTKGKMVTGHTVVPVACDNLTREFLVEFGEQIKGTVAELKLRESDYTWTAKDGTASGPGDSVSVSLETRWILIREGGSDGNDVVVVVEMVVCSLTIVGCSFCRIIAQSHGRAPQPCEGWLRSPPSVSSWLPCTTLLQCRTIT